MSDDHVEEVAAEEVEVEEEAPMSVLDALKEVRLFSLTFWWMLCLQNIRFQSFILNEDSINTDAYVTMMYC